jgi:hypothetical protein
MIKKEKATLIIHSMNIFLKKKHFNMLNNKKQKKIEILDKILAK